MSRLNTDQQLLDLANFGPTDNIPEPSAGDPGRFVEHARAALSLIGEELETFRNSAAQIRAQRGSRLTDDGVVGELAKLGASTIQAGAVASVRNVFLPKARGKLAKLDEAVADEFASASSRSDAAEAIEAVEIRTALRDRIGGDGLTAQLIIDEAIARGDARTVRALLDAPPSISVLTEDQIDDARERWMSAQGGEVARQRAELRRAIGALERRVDQFVQTVGAESGLPAADPVREAAGEAGGEAGGEAAAA